MDKDELIKEVTGVVRRYLPKDKFQIFLFGSWAKGDALDTSDVDIGILGEEKVPSATMTKILEEVEAIPTLRKTDVVDLNLVDDSFKENVLEYAKIL